MTTRILIIAGSDSGGGAGIQGDIKTVTALGGYGSTAITALTAQNTLGVQNILPIPAKFVVHQARCVLEDIGADIIKMGMLHNGEIISAISDLLDSPEYKNIPLILDPVMVAKGGSSLLENEAIESLKNKLIPRSYMITPNIPEAEILAAMSINNKNDMQKAAIIIQQMGAKTVLLKGGHGKGKTLYDLLLDESGYSHWIESKRINSNHTHGTGCAYASAISVFIGMGFKAKIAVKKAHKYIRQAIESAPKLGAGNGPLNHMANHKFD